MKRFSFVLILILLLLIACQQEDRIWVYIDPLQCELTDWEQVWYDDHDSTLTLWYLKTEQEKFAYIIQYYADEENVTIYKMKHTYPREAVRAMCGIPSFDRYHCYIDESDLNLMQLLGFAPEE